MSKNDNGMGIVRGNFLCRLLYETQMREVSLFLQHITWKIGHVVYLYACGCMFVETSP